MSVPLSLAAFALTAIAACLISADSSSADSSAADRLHRPVSLSGLYRHADADLDNGPLSANFAPGSVPALERHALPAAPSRPPVHQPYPPLAR